MSHFQLVHMLIKLRLALLCLDWVYPWDMDTTYQVWPCDDPAPEGVAV